MKKRFSFLFTLAITFSFVQGQTLNKSLGNLNSQKNIEQGITLKTENGNARILVYSPSVIRISITKNEQFDDFSYAVISKPGNAKFSITDNGNNLSLKTDSCTLIISKNPVRFQLLNNKGQLLNEDDVNIWNQ